MRGKNQEQKQTGYWTIGGHFLLLAAAGPLQFHKIDKVPHFDPLLQFLQAYSPHY